MKLNERTVYLASPAAGTLVHGNSYYVRRDGLEKARTRSLQTRSDLIDSDEIAYSMDNGRTWSPWRKQETIFHEPSGTRRVWRKTDYVDDSRDRLISVDMEGVLPTDSAMEGIRNYFLRCRVSNDGGRTSLTNEVVREEGFTPEHPFSNIWVGKNSIMIGDLGSRPIRTREGLLLVPAQATLLGPDGEYYNPGGGLTFHEATVLIGRWIDGEQLSWTMARPVRIDPAKSTRGAIEPTLAEMRDGRILMILRGSNGGKKDPNFGIPAYRWQCVSADGGRTWSDPRPWTYAESGRAFHSPSSCSQLLRHSNGRCYWLGNICRKNPSGNRPRYPLVIGQVDEESLQLIESTILAVDDLGDGEDPTLALSNFMAHEDRQTGQILLHMSRFYVSTFTGDAYLYRIDVD